MSELKKRVGVALWGIPLLLFLIYMGSYYFLIFILLVNGMALWEFYVMYQGKGIFTHRVPGVILSTFFLISVFFLPGFWQIMLLTMVVFILCLHLKRQEGMPSTNTVFTIGGIIYITLLLACMLQLRLNFHEWLPVAARDISTLGFEHFLFPGLNDATLAGGRYLIVLFGSIWICDSAAYSGGKKLGKHKLAPTVSPNKTVEGAAFGLVFGVLSFWGLGLIFLPSLPLSYALVSGLIVGTFGQIGDLVESRFKRDAGVKDTSNLLPGHGGILDRFDSLMFVSPFLLALFKYWGG